MMVTYGLDTTRQERTNKLDGLKINWPVATHFLDVIQQGRYE